MNILSTREKTVINILIKKINYMLIYRCDAEMINLILYQRKLCKYKTFQV